VRTKLLSENLNLKCPLEGTELNKSNINIDRKKVTWEG